MKRFNAVFKIIKIFLVVFPSLMVSQTNISTELISIRDGLSSNRVRNAIQDQYGYMWFATGDGVNKYDGYQFTIFKNIPDDSTSLPSNNTYQIFEDSDGGMWITTEGGLAKYNRRNNTFKTYTYLQSNIANDQFVFFMHEDKNKEFWISTFNGVISFKRDTEKFQKYDVLKSDNSIATFVSYGGTISENSEGEIYVASQSFGLLKFDRDASLFVQIPLKNDFREGGIFLSAVFDHENNLWLGYSDGLAKVDLNKNIRYDMTPYKKRKEPSGWRDNAASGLFIDRDQNIWIGTRRFGLYLFDTKKQKFEFLNGPPSASYFQFYQDKSGLLWLCSSMGAIKYDFDRKPFITYSLPDDGDGSNKAIYSISKSIINKNELWLATDKGIYQFDDQNNSFRNASAIDRKLSQFKEFGVFTVLESKNGLLWIASVNNGLYSYNTKSGKIENYKFSYYDENTISNNIVHCLAIDKDENLWVGTHSGLNILNKGRTKFKTIPSFTNRVYDRKLIEQLKYLRLNQSPTSSIINVGDYTDITKEFVIREDSKTIIYSMGEGLPQWNMVDYGWLESEQGDTIWTAGEYKESFHASGGWKNRIKIGALELKAGRYKLRYKSDDSHSAVSYNSKPPQDSTYWGTQIFTLDDNVYSDLSGRISNSEQETYLAGNDIKVIFFDSNHEAWVGTDDGLSHINSDFFITNYSKNSNSSNTISNNSVKDINEDLFGNIWIATANGLNKFDTKKKQFTVLLESDGLPSSNISAVQIDNEGDLWVSGIKGISKIELNDDGEMQIIVNYDVKDGLQGYEYIQSSSYKDEDGKLYFGGIDGFNSFYPGSSNRTLPFITVNDIKISNKSIASMGDLEDTEINLVSELSLSHNQNDLSFEFASIHFSRPEKNRLLFKMDGVDEDWQVGNRRFASYINLAPGDYTFNLKGSNGDGIWNEKTKKINIHISAPWYNNWTAYSIYALLFFGLLFSIRRFEMVRQRKNTQIKESHLRMESAELKAKAAEAQALVVQAENERKTKELEEARQLQLSMLPKELPQLPNLDIAVYMKTATEVGGDYYDFHIGMDGTLTVVLGDATGHGMKAGTMVTTTKSLFNVLAPNPDIVETFHEMTRCLKLMHLEKLSMCMSMLKITGSKVRMSAAGMPPIFIYKRDSQSMEEHVMKGMPLGTFNNFPYSIIESDLSTGDTILLMSDGFPELFNDEREMFGYKRARNLFEEFASESPEDIITKLKNAGSEWINDKDPDDDVTFVVIKVK